MELLSKEERNKIRHYPGGTNFKFGGETKIRSIETLEIVETSCLVILIIPLQVMVGLHDLAKLS